MEGLIHSFHLDSKLIIAQVINFSIVVLVLYKFAYKPLLAKMNERTEIIEKGLKDAKKSAEQLESAEKEREERIVAAKKEARQILQEAQSLAEKNKTETLILARQEAAEAIQSAKEKIESEKEKMFKEVRSEIGQLVILATQKVLNEKIDSEVDKKIIASSVKEVIK